MTEPPPSDFTRRTALQALGTAGAAGAVAATRGVSPALAQADWSPDLHPMAERMFVIDGVAHCYNHADYNRRIKRASSNSINTTHRYHIACTPESYRLTQEQWERDWQPDEVMDIMFMESHTDMMIMHSVPMFDLYYDGLVSNEKGAYLKGNFPDRVLWYGALDLFDPLDEVKTKANKLIDQGADGIKFYPTRINFETRQPEGWLMDDEKLAFPVFEHLQSKGVSHIAIHKLVGHVGPSTAALGVDDLYKAAEGFPDITFHLVHAGWQNFEETAALMKARENVTAVLEGPMLFPLFDMATFNDMMNVFMTKVDLDRLIYASTSVNQHPYWIINTFFDFQPPEGAPYTLSEDAKAKILGANLARYHGIDIPSQRLKIAGDKWSVAKRENGLRAPYIMQRS
jgi:predicted TIM-barrel fold metal-dependent hydrolase|tara:strand:+ start:3629 stop:4825 length:1197 start_codon:yes stop_codon:yes gene_type:complete